MTRSQISGSAIALLGGLFFMITPHQVESVQSGAFPRAISLLLTVFGILVVLMPGKREKAKDVPLVNPFLLSYLMLVLAAIVCIRIAGFYPAICLSLPGCLLLFGEREIRKIIVFTLATTGLIYLIIDILLGSPLP